MLILDAIWNGKTDEFLFSIVHSTGLPTNHLWARYLHDPSKVEGMVGPCRGEYEPRMGQMDRGVYRFH